MAAAPGKLNLEESPTWGSRSVECFEKLEQIGEGTYGQVYMAKDRNTGEIVALKKIRMDNEKEGFPITAIREIKLLKKLQHDNVIMLKEIVTSPGRDVDEQGNTDSNRYKGSIYMVFEYMDHDLTGLADRPGLRFSIPQIKCYMKQLLTGLYYCHVNQVLHRDIKGSNLLINNEGNLKLADFGLARSFSNDHNANLTNRVITLWYRPPELLLGATKYGPAVDMWSVGCIFAELLYGKPILPGKNETEQLSKIFELCGTPDESIWPGVSKIPWYNKFKPSRSMKRRVREVFRQLRRQLINYYYSNFHACFFYFSCICSPCSFDRHALDLLDRMLILDPTKRICAQDALDAEYFWADPLPCDPKSLPKYESSHEFQTKKKRQQQKQNEEVSKRQKLPYPHQHARLPPIQQSGQAHTQQWTGPNHPINNPQPPLPSGPSHHYSKTHGGAPAGPNRYSSSGNPSSGFYSDHGGQAGTYSSSVYGQVRGGSQYHGSGVPGTNQRGSSASGSGYAAPPNYSQGNQYGGPGAGRGPGNRNQQYGWQQ